MCPDRQLLSVFIDGELPSPWREKMAEHLAACPDCSARVALYRSLGSVSPADSAAPSAEAERIEAAKARVWREIAGLKAVERRPAAWIRPISLPLPAAVAAVLLVAFVAAWAGGPLVARATPTQALAQIADQNALAIPVSELSSVLSYLDAQDASTGIVIIKLPEAQQFVQSGQPSLVRAADYARGVAP
jgi:anti-sigma factor RsiW